MENQYELKDGCLRVHIPKEQDHHSAIGLREETDMIMRTYPVRRLIFDFSGTEFMDSSGIGVIIGRCKTMNYSGGSVEAEHLNRRIEKIFLVSGLNKIIKVHRADTIS